MNNHRLPVLVLPAAMLLGGLLITTLPVLAEEPDVSSVLARVQLLPIKDRAGPLRSGSETRDARSAKDSSGARPGTAADRWTEACSARFAKWVRHEDELVSFLIPDDPRVRLEVKTPEDRIPVGGGPVRSSGIDFVRCYRLTFRGDTYCLLLLDRQGEFDDTMCFCGHVAYEKYLQHHGALYRFSLLEDGRVKKIQVLGEGVRLVLFEWTHMPVHPEVYAQIALSIQWRQPPRDLPSLTTRIQQAYGKAGFLERGMDRNAVVALLGPPKDEDRDRLHYVFQRSHEKPPGSRIEEVTWKIPLRNGKFLGLTPDWCETRSLPPERNSVQWVLAKLEGTQGESDSVEPAREEELRPLLSRAIELLPEAREEHWWMLCDAALLLAQRGVKDPRVPELVKKRYLEPQLSAKYASELLREYDPDKSQELFAKRVRVEMALARRPDSLRKQRRLAYGWSYLKDLFILLSPEYGDREALILEAIDHPHAGVRMDGYSCSGDLPVSIARPRLRKGLSDSSALVRAHCAVALTELPASDAEVAEDLKLLLARLANEKDEQVVESLKKAIRRLE